MPSAKFFSIALLLPAFVSAANNWSKPCLNGTCSYDLRNGTAHGGLAGGSMFLNGSTSAISDLTAAAGWQILGCDADATNQTIRAICVGANATCSALYENGAVNTIVRLPEGCGRMPFARIASEFTDENQSVPDSVSQKLRRRDGEPDSAVRGITLDTSFGQIDPSHHGHVQMFIQGATGAAANSTSNLPTSKRSLEQRGVWDDIKGAVSSAVSDIEATFSYNKDSSISINEQHTFELYKKSQSCTPATSGPTFTAGFTVDATAKAAATLDYGFALAGTVVPPAITEFGMVAELDAQLDAILDLDISATIMVGTGNIQIFSVGLPGLDFPGILTVGPSFQINMAAAAMVSADAKMSVDLGYKATGAKLYFPDSSSSSWGNFAPSDTNINLAADPSVSASGSVTGHVIPTISFGISALDNAANVNVDLNIDASATLSTTLNKSLNSDFNGCLGIYAALGVNAVADGDFFSLFKKGLTVPLYSVNWDIWNKCFGTSARREHARAIPHFPSKRDTFVCNANSGSRVSVTSQTVPAASIKST